MGITRSGRFHLDPSESRCGKGFRRSERVGQQAKRMVTGGDAEAAGTGPRDARSVAFAQYLRRSAAAFSVSADATDIASTAEAGMALLDAALIAESLPAHDQGVRVLSEAGLFESMPDGRAAFVETPPIRAAVRRALVSDVEGGAAIIARLVATAAAQDDPPSGRGPHL
jgi:hypothetical protein